MTNMGGMGGMLHRIAEEMIIADSGKNCKNKNRKVLI